MTDDQILEIYNKANGIEGGKNPPITTQRIFTAMRAIAAAQREEDAAICETKATVYNNLVYNECAAAIRKGGESNDY